MYTITLFTDILIVGYTDLRNPWSPWHKKSLQS